MLPPPPQNNEDIGLLDGMGSPPPDDGSCPSCGMAAPNTLSISPDLVAIDGEAPQPGDTFIAQVEFLAQGVGIDGKIQAVAQKINDEPIDGSTEAEAPPAEDDDTIAPRVNT